MPLQETSGAVSYDAFGGGAPVFNYIEDVFSTYLYTGNGSTQTITNGIDLSGKGGLVWIKDRTSGWAQQHQLWDTARGATNVIYSDSTVPQATSSQGLTAFLSNGFSLGTNQSNNRDTNIYASWTFRKQPKFFDVVTYTGASPSSVTVNHNLGSVPGCIIIKCTNDTASWAVYHRSTGIGQILYLNGTQAASSDTTFVTAVTSTSFTVGDDTFTNNSPTKTYVAYLFAHDAGGFGISGTDNVITCGSYMGNGSTTGPVVTLGYEPQWLMIKRSDTAGGWVILDNMRGATTASGQVLMAQSTLAEENWAFVQLLATGFQPTSLDTWINASGSTYVYIAIRRGPMRTPTPGTSVFNTVLQSPQSAGTLRTIGFTGDLIIGQTRNGSDHYFQDRLRGLPSTGTTTNTASILSAVTNAEANAYPYLYNVWNTNARDGDLSYTVNGVGWIFGRAPGFFDVVCYTGTASGTLSVNHNLGVAPEFMIVKARSPSGWDWYCYSQSLGPSQVIFLNQNNASSTDTAAWNNQAPTSTVFRLAQSSFLNQTFNYVAYLFATVAGVSKVGSYTGTGTTLQVNCGFTGGARFVLIKRTDSTGDWYVWDSARGIVAGNDPYLLLNSTAAEGTGTDYIDTFSSGFEISSTAPAAINANGGTFIFLAIA
jgi:hypothetical protein